MCSGDVELGERDGQWRLVADEERQGRIDTWVSPCNSHEITEEEWPLVFASPGGAYGLMALKMFYGECRCCTRVQVSRQGTNDDARGIHPVERKKMLECLITCFSSRVQRLRSFCRRLVRFCFVYMLSGQ